MPVAAEEDTEERAEDEKDFDEDGGDGGDSVVVEMSQLVVRVRRDSGDSLGSEISHSPPSSPISRDQGRVGPILIPLKESRLQFLGNLLPFLRELEPESEKLDCKFLNSQIGKRNKK